MAFKVLKSMEVVPSAQQFFTSACTFGEPGNEDRN